MIDQRKTAWLIQKKIHRWSMQIQLGSIRIAIHDSAIPSTFPLTLPGQAKWSQAVPYLGGYWAMAPLCPRTFFWHWKKIGKLGLAPFCMSTSGQQNFGLLFEILNTPRSQGCCRSTAARWCCHEIETPSVPHVNNKHAKYSIQFCKRYANMIDFLKTYQYSISLIVNLYQANLT